ncbi:AAA family ATPase [Sphingobacterium sp. Mn56C]|uniref:AAA family ATPase n=1 Tax=Sphingobacterium sp. Mn56C TaxID=3395261 RepID=UPI003BC198A5
MNIYDLIINDKTVVTLDEVFLAPESATAVSQLIREHKHIAALTAYGLPVNTKILLKGQSGCGKTTTAKAIAQALGKQLLILNLSNIICSRIGETSQNIKQLFDKAAREKSVLFLDEFDQIGKARGNDDKDVGEMRRLVNTLLQLIDYFPKDALLICATNHAEIIDTALLRRFQVHINFQLPDKETLDRYYDQLLRPLPASLQQFERKYNRSFAEARDYAFTQAKGILLLELEQAES